RAACPPSPATIGPPALVVPNSSPKIQATRSNLAIATRPQLSAPTRTRAAAIALIGFLVCSLSVEILFIRRTVAQYEILSRTCIGPVQLRDGRRRRSAHWGTE